METELITEIRQKLVSCDSDFQSLIEKLLKDYEKKTKRMDKIVKQSDAQQLELIRLNQELEKSFQQLKIASETDPLTKIMNRYKSEIELETLFKDNISFSAMLIELDGYKDLQHKYDFRVINDTLVALAKILMRIMPSNAKVGRWSDGTFIILKQNYSLDEMFDSALEISESIESNIFNGIGKLTACIGVIQSTSSPSVMNILNALDISLKRAQQNGVNQVSV